MIIKKHKKDVEEKNKVEKFPGWSEIIRRMEEYETTADPDGWTRIDTPMAPDPENRLRMIPTPLGKPARTLYKSLWTGKATNASPSTWKPAEPTKSASTWQP